MKATVLDEDISAFDQHFACNFMDVLNEAAEIYASHLPEKGESWRQVSIDAMLSQWIGEVGEVLTLLGGGKYSPGRCKKEVLDVINQSLMLVKLINEKA